MKILILILFYIFLPNISFAAEEINVTEFIEEVQSYSNEIFPELSDENWLSNILSR